MDTNQERAESLCNEFSDWVLYDNINKSVIFNTTEDHLRILEHELAKLGYIEVHLSEILVGDDQYTYTCVYQRK